MELVGKIFAAKGKAIEENLEKDAPQLVRLAILTVACFFIAKVDIAGEVYPCGIAIITVLMNRSRMYLYMLPILLVSLYLNNVPGAYIWGDFMSVAACGITFMLLGNRRIALEVRALISLLITIICTSGYYIASRMLYRFDLQMLVFELFVIIALIYVLNFCSNVLLSRPFQKNQAMVPGAVAASTVLAACGIGIWGGNIAVGVHVPIILALAITLAAGFRLGITTGVTVGGASALVLIIAASQPPGTAAVYICGGFVAGFFRGSWRVSASICFVAACISLGLIRQFPEMYIDIVDPIAAGMIFMLLPKKLLKKLELFTLEIEREDSLSDHIVKERLLNIVYNCKRNFEELSIVYGDRGIGSSIVAQQFRGMLQVTAKMESELKAACKDANDDSSAHAFQAARLRKMVEISAAESGCAGENGISGDSRLCRELSDGRFLMILSDGMGKGEAAAAESGRAVRTIAALLEAGFEVESAIKTLNAIMLTRAEREIFTTIDIAIINRRTAQLRLYKIGAATTFIKRKEKVVAVKRKSLPMGIVDGLDIDYVNVRLRPDDQIIMVSDGITDSVRSDYRQEWLVAQIAAIRSTDCQTMCDLIINRAIENYGIREKDDLTVITAIVSQ